MTIKYLNFHKLQLAYLVKLNNTLQNQSYNYHHHQRINMKTFFLLVTLLSHSEKE